MNPNLRNHPTTTRALRYNELLRKSRAKQRIAQCLNVAKDVFSQMNFSGTHPAFKAIIARLTALRNGIDSARTIDDVSEQVAMAEAYRADVLRMKRWNPGNFASLYEKLGIDAPKSLGEAVRRKKRTASPAPQKIKAAVYDGTEPGDNVDLLLADARKKRDPKAFDPEGWRADASA